MKFDPFTFWGDFLSNATRDQRRMADAWELASRGFSTLQDMTRFWQELWGIEKVRSGGPDPLKMFSGLFPFPTIGFSSALGMVPLQEHLSMVEKYEEMKERVSAHEETIQHLKLLLNSKRCERKGKETDFPDLMKSQVESFFDLMRSMQLFPYK